MNIYKQIAERLERECSGSSAPHIAALVAANLPAIRRALELAGAVHSGSIEGYKRDLTTEERGILGQAAHDWDTSVKYKGGVRDEAKRALGHALSDLGRCEMALISAGHDFCVELERRRHVEQMLSRLVDAASNVCDEAWVGSPHAAKVIRCGELVIEARKFIP